VSHVPFRRGRFEELPELPRRPHPYFSSEPRTVTVDSKPFGRARVHRREHGSGPPLLLIHGLMTSSYSWRYVLDALGAHYRLYVPDLPGSGESDMPDVPYTAMAYATFLGELIDTLSIRGCRAIGNSLGGHLAMRLALADATAMSRLSVIHSPGVPDPRYRALAVASAVPFVKPLIERAILRDPYRWVHRNVHYWDESLKSLEEARAYGKPLSTPEGAHAFVRVLTEVLRPGDVADFERTLRDRRDRGERFPVPMAFVYAREDPMVPPRVGDALSRLVPDAGFTWLADTSHFAHVDSPERLVECVLPFLAGPNALPCSAHEPRFDLRSRARTYDGSLGGGERSGAAPGAARRA
jgi:pimeloyl-ACP methyl ester carboxylesterase